MAAQNLKTLVGKLNQPCFKALFEGAAGLCMSRTNYAIELEHYLLKLLESSDLDLQRILRHYDINLSRVQAELTRTLDKLKRGNDRAPGLSPDILDLLREAWVVASLDFQASKVRSGHLLAALLNERTLAGKIAASSPELAKIEADQLVKDLNALVKGTSEDQYEVADSSGGGSGGPSSEPGQAPASGKSQALNQFTQNLTERARRGEIDPVIGRDFEIRQVIDILTRRRQNNPILTGEAGVGKTAVVEGFALKIVAGDVPPPLRGVELRSLDLALLQAGAGVKGEFENRLKQVIADVKASPTPIILFIDEAHTLIGAGGAAGSGDAANLLKPALARGELRTVAATTWMEYKKYFEGDPALTRRFQVVKVEEPDIDKAIQMMRGLADTLERHHKVRVLDDAVAEAVKLSHRYITDRQLPDKSVSLLDTACAKVALAQSSLPAALEDARRAIDFLTLETQILERESLTGVNHTEKLKDLAEAIPLAEAKKKALEERWEKEKTLVAEVQKLRESLEVPFKIQVINAKLAKDEATAVGPGKLKPDVATRFKKELAELEAKKLTPEQEGAARKELNAKEDELHAIQGDEPLVLPVVDGQAVAEVVAGWTGIPMGKMVRDEIKIVQALDQKLKERIVGQDHALEAIAQRIRTSRANLADPRRPIGVFMLVGPSGVGKTETAMALADILFGGDRNMVVINMSEYKEDHKVSRLTGSAPGYVGYGEGGVLTESVRRKPYSVVLLDEVEKANVAVQEIFYQVFDKGMLQDDRGNEVNFKNTIIIMTSNVGTETVMKVCADPETRPEPDGLAQALRPDLLKSFKPALLGRIAIVPYYPLNDDMLGRIITLQLKRITDRIRQNHRAAFTYDESLLKTIAGRCKEVESGARNVDHILTGTLLPELSTEVLARMADGNAFSKVHVSVSPEGKFLYQID